MAEDRNSRRSEAHTTEAPGSRKRRAATWRNRPIPGMEGGPASLW